MGVNVKYRTSATARGGRDGQAQTDDGAFQVKLSTPKELGGAGGDGNNPEQLFAAGYAACFLGAMKAVAATIQVARIKRRALVRDSMSSPIGGLPRPRIDGATGGSVQAWRSPGAMPGPACFIGVADQALTP